MARWLIVAAVTTVWSITAQLSAHAAQVEGTFDDVLFTFAPAQSDYSGAGHVDIAYSLYTLMGEPVRLMKVRWSEKRRYPLSLTGIGKVRGVPEFSGAIPDDVLAKAQLYDFKIAIWFREQGTRDRGYFVKFDAGIPFTLANNQWSFNVPGSPNWNNLFWDNKGQRGTKTISSAAEPIPAAAAKAFMKLKLEAYDWTLVSAKLDLSPFKHWWRQAHYTDDLEIMLRGLKAHRTVLKDMLALPVSQIDAALAGFEAQLQNDNFGIAGAAALRQRMSKYLQRMNEGVPRRYVPDPLRDRYEKQTKEVAAWTEAKIEAARPPETEDKDAEEFRRWEEEKRAALEARMEEFKMLAMKPARDRNGKYGYKIDGMDAWVIEPKFIEAGAFRDNGLAWVALSKPESYERVKATKTVCGKKKTYYKEKYRRRVAYIDKSGAVVRGPEWEEYKKPWTLTLQSC